MSVKKVEPRKTLNKNLESLSSLFLSFSFELKLSLEIQFFAYKYLMLFDEKFSSSFSSVQIFNSFMGWKTFRYSPSCFD